MTSRKLWLASAMILASVANHAVAEERKTESKPVVFTIRLPADAELELEGTRMSGSGDVRRFQISSLDAGVEYNYNLRATWKEGDKTREVKRTIKIRAGQEVDVDLYPDDALTADEKLVLDLTNKEREKAGAPPLKANMKLCRAARGHSANMAAKNSLAHTLDGKTFSQRIDDTGYRSGEAGENCAQWAPTPADVIKMWMSSDGHRGNILNPRYKEIGVGIGTTKDGRKYWTQVFAVPIDQ